MISSNRNLCIKHQEHTYNSLILDHSICLIESIRSSSRLIKTLHYWVLKESSTRKISFSQRSRRLFASKTRCKTMKFSKFLNNISNSQAFFDSTSKNSFIIRQFLIYLLAFKSSSRCRCDTIFLCSFVCLRQLLKFVEISFASIYTSVIVERINVFSRVTKKKKLEIELIKVSVSSRRISFIDINRLIISKHSNHLQIIKSSNII